MSNIPRIIETSKNVFEKIKDLNAEEISMLLIKINHLFYEKTKDITIDETVLAGTKYSDWVNFLTNIEFFKERNTDKKPLNYENFAKFCDEVIEYCSPE